MVAVVFVHQDGTTEEVDADPDTSIMAAAVGAGVDGIIGECGGNAICGTCHVYVDPEWLPKLSAPARDEDEMLDFTAAEREPESRLSCQVPLTPDLAGISVRIPDSQTL